MSNGVMVTISGRVEYLKCSSCGKKVSSGYFPVPTDTPDRGLVVRAWIECPECIEAKPDVEHPFVPGQ